MHHVRVGDDQTVFVNNHTRSDTAIFQLAGAALPLQSEEFSEKIIELTAVAAPNGVFP